MDISFPNSGKLVTSVFDFPIEILLFFRTLYSDYVQDGVADIGIVGENVLIESKEVEEELQWVLESGWVVPYSNETWNINGGGIRRKSIATSYPILQNF